MAIAFPYTSFSNIYLLLILFQSQSQVNSFFHQVIKGPDVASLKNHCLCLCQPQESRHCLPFSIDYLFICLFRVCMIALFYRAHTSRDYIPDSISLRVTLTPPFSACYNQMHFVCVYVCFFVFPMFYRVHLRS